MNSNSRYFIGLSAENMGWIRLVNSTNLQVFKRDDVQVEVHYTRSGTVRSAYFTAPSGTDRITGGVPAIQDVFRMFGG